MTTKTLSFHASINIENKDGVQVEKIIIELQKLGCTFLDDTLYINREQKCKDGSYWIHPPIFTNLKTPICSQISHINGNFQ